MTADLRIADYHVDYQRKYRAAASGSDIGTPPEVVDPERRERCRDSLREFLVTYDDESKTFYAGFGEFHEKLIASIEECILRGGAFVVAMPRGSGKTTIMLRSILWATLYGHSRFGMLICSTDGGALQLHANMVTLLQSSDILNQDFPEITDAFRKVGGHPTRCRSQTCEREPTNIRMSNKTGVVFPNSKYSREAGNAANTIRIGSVGGSVRGAVVVTPTGESIRPDIVLIDDPQTRESARSPVQTQTRMDFVKGDVMPLGGPGKKRSVLITATVIESEDLAERLLDPKISPEFKRLRVKKLLTFPKQMEMWDEYWNTVMREAIGELDEGAANQYYVDNQTAMDEGASHYWPDRIESGRVTAIQSAMHEYLADPRSFMSECQNDPQQDTTSELTVIEATELVSRVSPCKPGVVPDGPEYLVCHIDVQLRALYYCVAAISQIGMGGSVVEYGCYPKQRSINFRYSQVGKGGSRTLQNVSKNNDDNGAIREGLGNLIKYLSEKQWPVDGTDRFKTLDRGLVDGGYRPDVVEAVLISQGIRGWNLAYGVGVKATSPLLKLREHKKGIYGPGRRWIIQVPIDRKTPAVFGDVNYWKTQAHTSLAVPATHSDAILLPKQDRSKNQMLADHLTSETSDRVEAKGRKVDEWTHSKSNKDNHLWDCFVGCLIAGSVAGARQRASQARRPQAAKSKPKAKAPQTRYESDDGWGSTR